MTTVHPSKIRKAQVSSGLKWTPTKWFQIDPLKAGFNKGNSVIWLFSQSVPHLGLKPYQYVRFDVALFPFLTEDPSMTEKYYKKLQPGERLLNFMGMPHVLFKGRLSISILKVFEV